MLSLGVQGTVLVVVQVLAWSWNVRRFVMLIGDGVSFVGVDDSSFDMIKSEKL